jgi:hypothetical protein
MRILRSTFEARIDFKNGGDLFIIGVTFEVKEWI